MLLSYKIREFSDSYCPENDAFMIKVLYLHQGHCDFLISPNIYICYKCFVALQTPFEIPLYVSKDRQMRGEEF